MKPDWRLAHEIKLEMQPVQMQQPLDMLNSLPVSQTCNQPLAATTTHSNLLKTICPIQRRNKTQHCNTKTHNTNSNSPRFSRTNRCHSTRHKIKLACSTQIACKHRAQQHRAQQHRGCNTVEHKFPTTRSSQLRSLRQCNCPLVQLAAMDTAFRPITEPQRSAQRIRQTTRPCGNQIQMLSRQKYEIAITGR